VQRVPAQLVSNLFGKRIAFSPIVTIEPRRRKFHCAIQLKIPVPNMEADREANESGALRLLCSITGGTARAQWEDVTGSTPLTLIDQCLLFTTTVSARFWLLDARTVQAANYAPKYASELYRHLVSVPFMASFVVFAKRRDLHTANVRVFCMTDDRESSKTLESQEHYVEVAKSRPVEVLEGREIHLEFGANLRALTSAHTTGLSITMYNMGSINNQCLVFHAFRENRLELVVRVKDVAQKPLGRLAFLQSELESVASHQQPLLLRPICNLNLELPAMCVAYEDIMGTPKRNSQIANSRVGDLTLAQVSALLDGDDDDHIDNNQRQQQQSAVELDSIGQRIDDEWMALALRLGIPRDEVEYIRDQCDQHRRDVHERRRRAETLPSPSLVLLMHWYRLTMGSGQARDQELGRALLAIGRQDIAKRFGFPIEPRKISRSTLELMKEIDLIPVRSCDNIYENVSGGPRYLQPPGEHAPVRNAGFIETNMGTNQGHISANVNMKGDNLIGINRDGDGRTTQQQIPAVTVTTNFQADQQQPTIERTHNRLADSDDHIIGDGAIDAENKLIAEFAQQLAHRLCLEAISKCCHSAIVDAAVAAVAPTTTTSSSSTATTTTLAQHLINEWTQEQDGSIFHIVEQTATMNSANSPTPTPPPQQQVRQPMSRRANYSNNNNRRTAPLVAANNVASERGKPNFECGLNTMNESQAHSIQCEATFSQEQPQRECSLASVKVACACVPVRAAHSELAPLGELVARTEHALKHTNPHSHTYTNRAIGAVVVEPNEVECNTRHPNLESDKEANWPRAVALTNQEGPQAQIVQGHTHDPDPNSSVHFCLPLSLSSSRCETNSSTNQGPTAILCVRECPTEATHKHPIVGTAAIVEGAAAYSETAVHSLECDHDLEFEPLAGAAPCDPDSGRDADNVNASTTHNGSQHQLGCCCLGPNATARAHRLHDDQPRRLAAADSENFLKLNNNKNENDSHRLSNSNGNRGTNYDDDDSQTNSTRQHSSTQVSVHNSTLDHSKSNHKRKQTFNVIVSQSKRRSTRLTQRNTDKLKFYNLNSDWKAQFDNDASCHLLGLDEPDVLCATSAAISRFASNHLTLQRNNTAILELKQTAVNERQNISCGQFYSTSLIATRNCCIIESSQQQQAQTQQRGIATAKSNASDAHTHKIKNKHEHKHTRTQDQGHSSSLDNTNCEHNESAGQQQQRSGHHSIGDRTRKQQEEQQQQEPEQQLHNIDDSSDTYAELSSSCEFVDDSFVTASTESQQTTSPSSSLNVGSSQQTYQTPSNTSSAPIVTDSTRSTSCQQTTTATTNTTTTTLYQTAQATASTSQSQFKLSTETMSASIYETALSDTLSSNDYTNVSGAAHNAASTLADAYLMDDELAAATADRAHTPQQQHLVMTVRSRPSSALAGRESACSSRNDYVSGSEDTATLTPGPEDLAESPIPEEGADNNNNDNNDPNDELSSRPNSPSLPTSSDEDADERHRTAMQSELIRRRLQRKRASEGNLRLVRVVTARKNSLPQVDEAPLQVLSHIHGQPYKHAAYHESIVENIEMISTCGSNTGPRGDQLLAPGTLSNRPQFVLRDTVIKRLQSTNQQQQQEHDDASRHATSSSSASLSDRSPMHRRSRDSSIVSQCSVTSSVLSDHTRNQLNFDLSPDLPPDSDILDANAMEYGDLNYRPPSPVPPSSASDLDSRGPSRWGDRSMDSCNESDDQVCHDQDVATDDDNHQHLINELPNNTHNPMIATNLPTNDTVKHSIDVHCCESDMKSDSCEIDCSTKMTTDNN
ncbi:Ankyrin-2, partial [Fragariocoptes setiger]